MRDPAVRFIAPQGWNENTAIADLTRSAYASPGECNHPISISQT
jgi:hypothetical protein